MLSSLLYDSAFVRVDTLLASCLPLVLFAAAAQSNMCCESETLTFSTE